MKVNDDKNNTINKNYIKNKLIHDYFMSFKNQALKGSKIEENYSNIKDCHNIYIKYLKDPQIIFQDKGDIKNKNLKLLFDELNQDIKNGNNIIFPFLNIFPNLVKAYIESDLDEDNLENKGKTLQIVESNYINIFEKLKNNCFISKECLFPIYDYFKYLYDIVTNKKELKENDNIFRKLNKVINLFEIFYETNVKEKKVSSFCFLGGNIDILFNKAIQLSEISKITIKIKFLNNEFIEYLNDNSNLLKINENEIKYKIMKEKIGNKKFENINIIINDEIKFEIDKNKFSVSHKTSQIKVISLLEEFYGQIFSIEISIGTNKNKIEYQFLPYILRNDNNIYYIKKNIITIEKANTLNNNVSPKIIINDKNQVNINYINYNDSKFDIIGYFGGVIQFLPFHKIFKTLLDSTTQNDYKNKYINKDRINDFLNFIIKVIIIKLFSSNKKKKILKKYVCFFYYILLDINMDLDNSFLLEYEKKKNCKNIYYYIDLLSMLYYNLKNTNIEKKNEIQVFLDSRDNKEKVNLNFFVYPKKTFNQIYKNYMKSLFYFNNLWSKRNNFFPKRYNNKQEFEIKYKQLNYYTKNYMLPFIYPISNYTKYYPSFSRYKNGNNLFKENKRNILEYDFKLEPNKKAEEFIKILFLNKNLSIFSEKCCMVKNTHHIFGELALIKNNQKEKSFKIIFTGKKEKENNQNIKNENENSINSVDKEKSTNKEISNKTSINCDFCFSKPKGKLCYGATFKCPDRDYNKNIVINSKDILFLLIRVYYHRVSGIEIFTINKSYYFNFQKYFDVTNLKTNIILNEMKNNPFFIKIKNKKDNLKLGYYNIKYKTYLFPLFEDEINNWDKKYYYFSNFDILILINLFSNRSYRDIYQYPIFPILYDLLNIRRDLSQHVGLQDYEPASKVRKDLFLKTFKSNDEDKEINEEMCIFSIHYSNPAFTFNYLLRVIPYTFLSIEFQGDGFDDPNRLFFSIEKALKSSLRIKSDLREMIPELYYMIELFYNKNNILFSKTKDGTTIDNVYIKDKEIFESDIARKENYAKFLFMMRNNLEKRHINKWIDLIFGINQKYYVMDEKNIYKYYDKSSEIVFKNDLDIIKNELTMDLVNFGLLPYQLLSKNFPSIQKKDKDKLNKLNIELFKDEHIKMNTPIQTFLCKGRILIEDNYLKMINPKLQLNKIENYYNISENISQKILKLSKNELIFNNTLDLEIEQIDDKIFKDKISLSNYYFVGDIFGSVLIYNIEKGNIDKTNEIDENKEKYEEEEINNIEENEEIIKYGSFEIIQDEEIQKTKLKKNEIKNIEYYNLFGLGQLFNNKIINLEIKLFKQLNDHINEIKYIDFNPRLNIFLSYSLDNFINIYIFPKLKLINVIDTIGFRDENDKNIFDRVVLISYPFPLIVCHNTKYIYLLTINGDLIKYNELNNEDKIVFSVDKNLGIVEDKVEIYNSEGNLKCSFNYFN